MKELVLPCCNTSSALPVSLNGVTPTKKVCMSKRMRNSIEMVVGQFQDLLEKCFQTKDDNERVVLVRKLVNLLGVIQFLILVQTIIPDV
jgi:hypothetical protein